MNDLTEIMIGNENLTSCLLSPLTIIIYIDQPNQNPRTFQEILEKPKEILGNCRKFQENLKILENPRKSQEILENSRKSQKILENLRKPQKILEKSRNPKKSQQNLKILENSKKSFLFQSGYSKYIK